MISSLKAIITNQWLGHDPLWKAALLYGFVALVIFRILIEVTLAFVPALSITVRTLFLIYFIWNSVSIWNCAFNVKSQIFGYLARTVIIIFWGSALIAIGYMFGLGTASIPCSC